MEILFEFGFEEKEILDMINQCIDLKLLSKEEVLSKIAILKRQGCKDRHIKNILVSNPYYLCRSDSDIIKLINYLKDIKFDCIYLLLDSNPYILNRNVYEIEEYINNKVKEGNVLEDIVDYLDSNPYIFDEL